ncbi:GreA/GreB family elongation factor [Brevibacillus nitrificans]|uniref:GreA/GreB family elongation factor n=1 Tax=Brevibacillus nitrificans TaxID=651560 RepID=UPI002858015D|nr:GreA/GreB family elongation factor [Brevibacillus nitrificans]MDR7316492.1 transcription elongation GreA/GreB family factor [Brevibacillus nitrificans]
MNHRTMDATREQLIQQLVFFDEQYSLFFDHYVRDYGKEKQTVDTLIKRYRDTLEDILAKDDGALSESLQSVALLGSSVHVRFEEDGYEELFTVVFPTDIDPDQNRISFLSPIGRQLLLSAPHESIVLESPAGRQSVQIGEVRFAYRGGFPSTKEGL